MQERLQKIIAAAGITSRRKAEELIQQGRVSVNGHTVTELGSKADAGRDKILVNGRPLRGSRRRVVILMNKPDACVSTASDPQRRPTVISLLRGVKERVYPVGRLDYHSTGLLLLTNDGALANLLMSRAARIPRTYRAKLEAMPDAQQLSKLEQGIVLDGYRTAPCRIRVVEQGVRPWVEITLVEGRYHQVRRMFERVACPVIKLRRVRFAFLTDHGLRPGQFRELTPPEVERLKSWKVAEKL